MKHNGPRVKTDISLEQYQEFSALLGFKTLITQIVYLYFDTSARIREAKLLKEKIRLRAKIKNGIYSLQLKNKAKGNIFEVKDILSFEEFQKLLQGEFPLGRVKEALSAFDLLGGIKLVGATLVLQKRNDFMGGTLTLNQTICQSEISHQLEFSARSQEQIDSFNDRFALVEKFTSKLRRFWKAK